MKLEELLVSPCQIHVMDVGASCIAETPVYKCLLDAHLASLSAFEGDSRQIAKIKETYSDKVTIFNDFLFDGTQQTLYVASEESGMTSLLKPDLKAAKFFNGFEEIGAVHSTEKVQTKRLDEVANIPPVDFLKMDIQGAELTVLENGSNTLKECLAIQLEISYICLYEKQPTFGEIDVWMRRNGYAPHCFLDVKRWSIAPTVKNNNFREPFNQLLESDIVYVKNPLDFSSLSIAQLKKMALMAHYCFFSYDLCVHSLLELISRNALSPDSHLKYLAILNQMK